MGRKNTPQPTNKIGLLASSLVVILTIAAFVVPSVLIRQYHKYAFDNAVQVAKVLTKEPKVGMVLGGGIDNQGRPRPVLAQRLNASIELYREGVINRILVTGDNRTESYNEPAAMFNYLVAEGIPAEVITQDFAGRSTYESCERAAKVFNVTQMVAITQADHLDRVIYLCRSFGIETYGFSAQSAGVSPRIGQVVREFIANSKAVLNVYFIGEQTILGEQQPIQ